MVTIIINGYDGIYQKPKDNVIILDSHNLPYLTFTYFLMRNKSNSKNWYFKTQI